MKAYLLPRLQDMLFMTIFLAVIGLGPRLLNVDGDLGRHLTIGGYILESRSIPTRDLFSFTMVGEPLTPHEWLAQLIYALAYRLAGLDGVIWLCALLIAATFTLVFRRSLADSEMILAALGWTLLSVFASSLHWLARPHLFTLLMVVLWTGELEGLRRKQHRRWWLFPLLMLAWANLHGAFISGFAIWGLYLAGEVWEVLPARDANRESPEAGRWPLRPFKERLLRECLLKELVLIGATSFLASLLNPSGLHLWGTSLGYLRNRYLVSHTAEYFSPNFHHASTWPFLLLLVLSLWMLSRWRVRLPAALAMLLAGWTAMGLYSVRNVPLYALLAAPLLAEITSTQIRRSKSGWAYLQLEARLSAVETGLRGHFWPVLMVLLLSFGLASGSRLDLDRQGNQFDPAVFPVQAVDWLETQSPGRMFNYFPWGGYLLYRAWPQRSVFIDGQTDFYGEALTRQYEQVISLAYGWQAVLEYYRVDRILMPPGSLLARALRTDPGWILVYQDETAAVFAQR